MPELLSILLRVLWPIRLCIAPVARGILYLINNSLRIIGPCLVLLALGLITLFTCEVLYIRWKDPPVYILSWIIHGIVDILILVNLFRSYYHALVYGPGDTPLVNAEGGLSVDVLSIVPLVCRKCIPQRFKLPRAHHCSTCGKCIRRMDHHCPWLNQCVGEYNYPYFLVFLLWTLLGSSYALSCLAPAFYSVVLSNDVSSPLDDFTDTQEYYLTMASILSLAIFLAVVGLGGFHCYLIAVDKTSLELQLFAHEEFADVETVYQSLLKTDLFTLKGILATKVLRSRSPIDELELPRISV